MAGPKGVVNLLQQFLKTGASSGTLDAALGACKVRTERFFFTKICNMMVIPAPKNVRIVC